MIYFKPEIETEIESIGTDNAPPIMVQQGETSERNEQIQNAEPVTPRIIRVNHSLSDIIGERNDGVLPRTQLRARDNTCLVSEMESRMVKDAQKR